MKVYHETHETHDSHISCIPDITVITVISEEEMEILFFPEKKRGSGGEDIKPKLKLHFLPEKRLKLHFSTEMINLK